MKLKNRKTGETGYLIAGRGSGHYVVDKHGFNNCGNKYNSLAELNEEWEDYKEPKEYWFISTTGKAHRFEGEDETYTPDRKQLGNYFETKEEAEKAVEKLKAWKRLKDKGFRFYGVEVFSEGLLGIDGVLSALKKADNAERLKIVDDLELLFGGEDE